MSCGRCMNLTVCCAALLFVVVGGGGDGKWQKSFAVFEYGAVGK